MRSKAPEDRNAAATDLLGSREGRAEERMRCAGGGNSRRHQRLLLTSNLCALRECKSIATPEEDWKARLTHSLPLPALIGWGV
ncbi:hypothetical protein NDU88_000742 [Pleurodeles waltl]|uniref:Uncharacterized protein n=1 Tax=Pleurodeles waltl TaxID=8319 RepID=A0AAV7VYE4_PLEWA|nr:hypothetical protein NDU88_000742 [Pleurodeles waltl]